MAIIICHLWPLVIAISIAMDCILLLPAWPLALPWMAIYHLPFMAISIPLVFAIYGHYCLPCWPLLLALIWPFMAMIIAMYGH